MRPVADGYSVNEAASVLGVSSERVWELLARGVLAGAPEDGGGMRVYLQGRPAASVAEPPKATAGAGETAANGNGGAHRQSAEGSPFRELLTEFRNLTERYGQALLALGEARGEVASLRSRVERLEARMEFRLPFEPQVPWSHPEEVPAPEAPHEEMALEPAAAAAEVVRPEAFESGPSAEPEPEEPEEVRWQAELDAHPEPALWEPAEPEAEIARAEEAPVSVVPPGVQPPEISPPGEPIAAAQPVEPGETLRRRKGRSRQRRLRRGRRAAVAGILQALARAEDPTVTAFEGDELSRPPTTPAEVAGPESAEPVAEEADYLGLADSFAASEVVADSFLADEELRGQTADWGTSAEPELESPVHVTEAERADVEDELIAVPEESAPLQRPAEPAPGPAPEPAAEVQPYSSEWDEPDWIAEEDLEGSWPPPTPSEPESEVVGLAPEPPGAATTVGAPVETATEEREPPVDEEAAEAEPSPAEPESPPAAEAVEEEELMWLGDEFAPERSAWSAPSVPSPGVAAAEDQALTRMAAERGWDEDELRAIRSLLQQPDAPEQAPEPAQEPAQEQEPPQAEADASAEPMDSLTPDQVSFAEEEAMDWEQGPSAWTPEPPESQIELPGADELDDAMAALESPATEAKPEEAVPKTPGEEHEAIWSKPPVAPTHEPDGSTPGQEPGPGDATDEAENPDDDWLHGRRGPAANAYRRLRRLFPS